MDASDQAAIKWLSRRAMEEATSSRLQDRVSRTFGGTPSWNGDGNDGQLRFRLASDFQPGEGTGTLQRLHPLISAREKIDCCNTSATSPDAQSR